MLGGLKQFAAGDSGIHVSLKAEELFQWGPLTVTNATVYGILCAIVLGILMVMAARRLTVKPQKGPIQLLEIMMDFITGLLEGTFNSRKRAVQYAPIFGFFFLFIIFNNIAGIIPLVGPAFTVNGDIPIFRPFTADLNGTLAMAIVGIVLVQVLSIKEQGVKGHLTHYFSDKPANPINFFIGILEVFGEFTRILSLALRLFLNTAVGEILIAVFTSMIAPDGQTPLAVIPILLFEVLVAGIQAYVFTVLCATYLAMATAHAHDHDHDPEPTIKEVPAIS